MASCDTWHANGEESNDVDICAASPQYCPDSPFAFQFSKLLAAPEENFPIPAAETVIYIN